MFLDLVVSIQIDTRMMIDDNRSLRHISDPVSCGSVLCGPVTCGPVPYGPVPYPYIITN